MELHTSPRVSSAAICERYLDQLAVSAEQRQALLSKTDGIPDSASSLSTLHQALSSEKFDDKNPAQSSVSGRIQASYGREIAAQLDPETTPVLTSAPPVNRSPMAPVNWPPRPLRALVRKVARWLPLGDTARRYTGQKVQSDSPDPRGHWHQAATHRRLTLLLLVIVQTALATYSMTAILPYHGEKLLEVAIMGLFALLCAWVSAGFWTALMGYLVLQFRGDRYSISATATPDAPIPPDARTAIVMPICNEHVPRVFAGLRATYESLARNGNLEHFDFYILSDTSDPDTRIAETEAWLELCRAAGGFGRIFYRWRKHRISRKSGNVADFCRRWGANYRYMVVLDADSVMSGACLSRLVQLMEANPNAGLIQTGPTAAGRDTFYARLQQSASRVYGPLYLAGLHFWQLGESHYWGHNAIIRVAPFIKHCALGRLPGKGSLSGEILSHDFVEAALMRKAGWAVWIVYDLPGSYEEMPPNLLDELNRDRRWCHGNLINFRLFWAPGFHVAHRAVFMTGVIAYVSALMWLTFLLLSTSLLAYHTLVEPEYFVQPNQLFPLWPEWHPERALALFGVTAAWLFLPKILSVVLILLHGAQEYGGAIKLILGMLLEWIISMLMAPIRMLFHTQFVLAALTGLRIQWKSPPREDAATPWNIAFRRHGWHSVLGLAWGSLVYWLNPSYLLWMMPILGALALSVPISVITSSPLLGRRLRRLGLFLIPEETNPPTELQAVQEKLACASPLHGFADAIANPRVNALAGAITRSRAPDHMRRQLVDHALRNGPSSLDAREKLNLLNDATMLSQLHLQVWTSPLAHPDWLSVKMTAPNMETFELNLKPAYT